MAEEEDSAHGNAGWNMNAIVGSPEVAVNVNVAECPGDGERATKGATGTLHNREGNIKEHDGDVSVDTTIDHYHIDAELLGDAKAKSHFDDPEINASSKQTELHTEIDSGHIKSGTFFEEGLDREDNISFSNEINELVSSQQSALCAEFENINHEIPVEPSCDMLIDSKTFVHGLRRTVSVDFQETVLKQNSSHKVCPGLAYEHAFTMCDGETKKYCTKNVKDMTLANIGDEVGDFVHNKTKRDKRLLSFSDHDVINGGNSANAWVRLSDQEYNEQLRDKHYEVDNFFSEETDTQSVDSDEPSIELQLTKLDDFDVGVDPTTRESDEALASISPRNDSLINTGFKVKSSHSERKRIEYGVQSTNSACKRPADELDTESVDSEEASIELQVSNLGDVHVGADLTTCDRDSEFSDTAHAGAVTTNTPLVCIGFRVKSNHSNVKSTGLPFDNQEMDISYNICTVPGDDLENKSVGSDDASIELRFTQLSECHIGTGLTACEGEGGSDTVDTEMKLSSDQFMYPHCMMEIRKNTKVNSSCGPCDNKSAYKRYSVDNGSGDELDKQSVDSDEPSIELCIASYSEIHANKHIPSLPKNDVGNEKEKHDDCQENPKEAARAASKFDYNEYVKLLQDKVGSLSQKEELDIQPQKVEQNCPLQQKQEKANGRAQQLNTDVLAGQVAITAVSLKEEIDVETQQTEQNIRSQNDKVNISPQSPEVGNVDRNMVNDASKAIETQQDGVNIMLQQDGVSFMSDCDTVKLPPQQIDVGVFSRQGEVKMEPQEDDVAAMPQRDEDSAPPVPDEVDTKCLQESGDVLSYECAVPNNERCVQSSECTTMDSEGKKDVNAEESSPMDQLYSRIGDEEAAFERTVDLTNCLDVEPQDENMTNTESGYSSNLLYKGSANDVDLAFVTGAIQDKEQITSDVSMPMSQANSMFPNESRTYVTPDSPTPSLSIDERITTSPTIDTPELSSSNYLQPVYIVAATFSTNIGGGCNKFDSLPEKSVDSVIAKIDATLCEDNPAKVMRKDVSQPDATLEEFKRKEGGEFDCSRTKGDMGGSSHNIGEKNDIPGQTDKSADGGSCKGICEEEVATGDERSLKDQNFEEEKAKSTLNNEVFVNSVSSQDSQVFDLNDQKMTIELNEKHNENEKFDKAANTFTVNDMANGMNDGHKDVLVAHIMCERTIDLPHFRSALHNSNKVIIEPSAIRYGDFDTAGYNQEIPTNVDDINNTEKKIVCEELVSTDGYKKAENIAEVEENSGVICNAGQTNDEENTNSIVQDIKKNVSDEQSLPKPITQENNATRPHKAPELDSVDCDESILKEDLPELIKASGETSDLVNPKQSEAANMAIASDHASSGVSRDPELPVITHLQNEFDAGVGDFSDVSDIADKNRDTKHESTVVLNSYEIDMPIGDADESMSRSSVLNSSMSMKGLPPETDVDANSIGDHLQTIIRPCIIAPTAVDTNIQTTPRTNLPYSVSHKAPELNSVDCDESTFKEDPPELIKASGETSDFDNPKQSKAANMAIESDHASSGVSRDPELPVTTPQMNEFDAGAGDFSDVSDIADKNRDPKHESTVVLKSNEIEMPIGDADESISRSSVLTSSMSMKGLPPERDVDANSIGDHMQTIVRPCIVARAAVDTNIQPTPRTNLSYSLNHQNACDTLQENEKANDEKHSSNITETIPENDNKSPRIEMQRLSRLDSLTSSLASVGSIKSALKASSTGRGLSEESSKLRPRVTFQMNEGDEQRARNLPVNQSRTTSKTCVITVKSPGPASHGQDNGSNKDDPSSERAEQKDDHSELDDSTENDMKDIVEEDDFNVVDPGIGAMHFMNGNTECAQCEEEGASSIKSENDNDTFVVEGQCPSCTSDLDDTSLHRMSSLESLPRDDEHAHDLTRTDELRETSLRLSSNLVGGEQLADLYRDRDTGILCSHTESGQKQVSAVDKSIECSSLDDTDKRKVTNKGELNPFNIEAKKNESYECTESVDIEQPSHVKHSDSNVAGQLDSATHQSKNDLQSMSENSTKSPRQVDHRLNSKSESSCRDSAIFKMSQNKEKGDSEPSAASHSEVLPSTIEQSITVTGPEKKDRISFLREAEESNVPEKNEVLSVNDAAKVSEKHWLRTGGDLRICAEEFQSLSCIRFEKTHALKNELNAEKDSLVKESCNADTQLNTMTSTHELQSLADEPVDLVTGASLKTDKTQTISLPTAVLLLKDNETTTNIQSEYDKNSSIIESSSHENTSWLEFSKSISQISQFNHCTKEKTLRNDLGQNVPYKSTHSTCDSLSTEKNVTETIILDLNEAAAELRERQEKMHEQSDSLNISTHISSESSERENRIKFILPEDAKQPRIKSKSGQIRNTASKTKLRAPPISSEQAGSQKGSATPNCGKENKKIIRVSGSPVYLIYPDSVTEGSKVTEDLDQTQPAKPTTHPLSEASGPSTESTRSMIMVASASVQIDSMSFMGYAFNEPSLHLIPQAQNAGHEITSPAEDNAMASKCAQSSSCCSQADGDDQRTMATTIDSFHSHYEDFNLPIQEMAKMSGIIDNHRFPAADNWMSFPQYRTESYKVQQQGGTSGAGENEYSYSTNALSLRAASPTLSKSFPQITARRSCSSSSETRYGDQGISLPKDSNSAWFAYRQQFRDLFDPLSVLDADATIHSGVNSFNSLSQLTDVQPKLVCAKSPDSLYITDDTGIEKAKNEIGQTNVPTFNNTTQVAETDALGLEPREGFWCKSSVNALDSASFVTPNIRIPRFTYRDSSPGRQSNHAEPVFNPGMALTQPLTIDAGNKLPYIETCIVRNDGNSSPKSSPLSHIKQVGEPGIFLEPTTHGLDRNDTTANQRDLRSTEQSGNILPTLRGISPRTHTSRGQYMFPLREPSILSPPYKQKPYGAKLFEKDLSKLKDDEAHWFHYRKRWSDIFSPKETSSSGTTYIPYTVNNSRYRLAMLKDDFDEPRKSFKTKNFAALDQTLVKDGYSIARGPTRDQPDAGNGADIKKQDEDNFVYERSMPQECRFSARIPPIVPNRHGIVGMCLVGNASSPDLRRGMGAPLGDIPPQEGSPKGCSQTLKSLDDGYGKYELTSISPRLDVKLEDGRVARLRHGRRSNRTRRSPSAHHADVTLGILGRPGKDRSPLVASPLVRTMSHFNQRQAPLPQIPRESHPPVPNNSPAFMTSETVQGESTGIRRANRHRSRREVSPQLSARAAFASKEQITNEQSWEEAASGYDKQLLLDEELFLSIKNMPGGGSHGVRPKQQSADHHLPTGETEVGGGDDLGVQQQQAEPQGLAGGPNDAQVMAVTGPIHKHQTAGSFLKKEIPRKTYAIKVLTETFHMEKQSLTPEPWHRAILPHVTCPSIQRDSGGRASSKPSKASTSSATYFDTLKAETQAEELRRKKIEAEDRRRRRLKQIVTANRLSYGGGNLKGGLGMEGLLYANVGDEVAVRASAVKAKKKRLSARKKLSGASATPLTPSVLASSHPFRKSRSRSRDVPMSPSVQAQAQARIQRATAPPPKVLADGHYDRGSNILSVVVKPVHVQLSDDINLKVQVHRAPAPPPLQPQPPAEQKPSAVPSTRRLKFKRPPKPQLPILASNIVDLRAINPPFNTAMSPEASRRFEALYGRRKVL